MPPRLTNQVERLSYTRRDIEVIDDEVDRFITSFIPVIRNVNKSNVGRLFLRVLEGVVDKLNYSVDMRFRQTVLRTVRELQSAMDITEIVRFRPGGTVSATADLTATTLTGPAAPGGISIPQFSIFTTETAPIKQYLSLEATAIPEGASVFSPIAVVEGTRVVSQIILASAAGDPNELIKMPVAKTPHAFLEIAVDGTTFNQQVDLSDSLPEDRDYSLKDDEDRFTTITFGDGDFGVKLTPGAEVRATYIKSSGIDSNSPNGKITGVLGALAQQISVTNPEAAAGGTDGDEIEDIVRNAPKQASAFFTASNDPKTEALAEAVDGVFRALADPGDGAFLTIFIMPEGGGVASSTLLTLVETTVAPNLIFGTTLDAQALLSAHILIDMRVVLKKGVNVNKSVARRRVFEAISAFKLSGEKNPDGALFFKNLTIGRGFAQSDLDALVENIDDGKLVDFVDFLVLTRYPTPVASNPAAPNFKGEIVPLAPADYDTWSIQAVTTTTFQLLKNGSLDSQGTVGVELTSADGSIVFTLGETTDTFTIGDNWTFKTSAFRNSMRLDKLEFMELVRDSDLNITVFFNDEFIIGES